MASFSFPTPTVPEKTLFEKLILDSVIIAVVGYSITLSMAKLFANKFNYTVDGNQEIFAEVSCSGILIDITRVLGHKICWH